MTTGSPPSASMPRSQVRSKPARKRSSPRSKPHKLSTCPICRSYYPQWSSLKPGCSTECRAEINRQKDRKRAAKLERLETRQALVKLRTARDWTKLAQAEFNRWVKCRDAFLPCVSCGTTKQKRAYHKIDGWVASHYRSVGACPELRFEESNVHRACVRCNSWLSGNISEYRIGLLARIGAEKLAWLEGPHEPKRYRIEELTGIRDQYRAKVKHLKFTREHAASAA